MSEFGSTPHGAEEDAASRHVETARHLIEVERFDLAEKHLRAAMTSDPEDSATHTILGWVLKAQDNLVEAEEEARAALALDPADTSALRLLADIREDEGEHQEAEEILLEALRLSPVDPHLFCDYAYLMYKTGHLDKAERLTRRALQQDPESERAHALLSSVLSERDKDSESLAHGEHAVRLAPEEESSHAAVGLAHIQGGRPFAARSAFREALRHSPSDPTLEELYEHADFQCRWTYLPMYYLSLVLQRIPGGPFALWGGFVVVLMALRSTDVDSSTVSAIAIGWLCLCVYTWVASPITKAWIKLVPRK